MEWIPVTLGEDETWDKRLTPGAIGLLMMHLLRHDFKSSEKLVYPSLAVDMPSRRRADNMPNLEAAEVPAQQRPDEPPKLDQGVLRSYRRINKALSMELLTALLLTRLDSAERVRSWCCTRDGLPNNFAPSGAPDITASYPASEGTPAFQVVAEVSAKREVTDEFYRTQLTQALEHAKDQLDRSEERPIYALAINGGRIASDVRLQKVYREFVEKNGLDKDGPIRVIPMFAGDLAVALRRMEVRLAPDRFRFGTDSLAQVFNALHEGLRRDEPNADADWMCNSWLDTVNAQPTLDLSDEPSGTEP